MGQLRTANKRHNRALARAQRDLVAAETPASPPAAPAKPAE
ncbi:MAG TPA: hypothetical protein VGC10_06170 [Sphingomonas sp.]